MWLGEKETSRGFSLLEVLSAIFLLAGLISIVVQLSYGNNRRMQKARQLNQISHLLELKMLELEERFKGVRVIELPQEAEGGFEEEGYFWSYTTQAFSLPSDELLLSLAGLPQNSINSQMIQTFKDILSKTVIELKLTVRYENERDKKPQSYSLVSYFINYEEAPDFIFSHIQSFLQAGSGL